MPYLLDTVAFYFASKTPERLSKRVADIFADPETDLLLSSVSLSEIAIKNTVGKTTLPLDDLKRGLEDLRIQLVSYTPKHAIRLFEMPVHHRDPFDRQIIAQAMSEEVPVITCDEKFRLYEGLEVVW
ncbi:MAG TPA: type II toxin-antitoxin system VapC family toxin [Candidatus Acidoferrum sp.]|nr:type II toxin-antitoxin system VapC family toxin [Candidatus Acidoferrum sp.]